MTGVAGDSRAENFSCENAKGSVESKGNFDSDPALMRWDFAFAVVFDMSDDMYSYFVPCTQKCMTSVIRSYSNVALTQTF